MNIHEYQGKSVLKKYGVRIQEGLVADTPDKAVEVARELSQQTGTKWYVVKSQIHAGGRGKGRIVGTEQRGVALAKSVEDVRTISNNILGKVLVTHQTGLMVSVLTKCLLPKTCIIQEQASRKNIIFLSSLTVAVTAM